MRHVRYEQMFPREIVERRTAHPVAFLGLGGIEWHGEHLATGNDQLKATRLCELAAHKGGGICFPPLWYGEPRDAALMETSHDADGKIRGKMKLPARNFTPSLFPNSAEEQIAFYQKLLLHTFIQIRTLGFKAIVVVAGHYPIHDWAKQPVRAFNRRFDDCKVFCGIEFHYAPAALKRGLVGGDHAAKWETSYLMALRPECVDMSVYRGRRKTEKLVGIGGTDPRDTASRALGERAVKLIVDGMVRKGNALLKKARGAARAKRRKARAKK